MAHEVSYPTGTFDLPTELARLRAHGRSAVIPPDLQAQMDRQIDELRRANLVDRVPRVGEPAPDFVLPNARGTTTTLSDLLRTGPVVLVFYRGHWCPFCNLTLRALQQILGNIASMGGTLVAVSPQSPDNSLSTAEKNGLAYEVLSDVGAAVAKAYGLAFDLPAYLQKIYDVFGHPLPRFNGEGQNTLPVPATFVIDDRSLIRYRFVDPDYTRRADPSAILAALAHAGRESAEIDEHGRV